MKSPPHKPKLTGKEYVSFDGDKLGYQKWLPKRGKPKLVIIGVHGISGHAGDYENLGVYLVNNNPEVALYASETRGQGMDPAHYRRGDIRCAKDWYRDLYTFSRLVQAQHPQAKIVWFGESMGALIVMNAYQESIPGEVKPSALVISSPIIEVASKLPRWKLILAQTTALIFPRFRVSLENLSDGERPVVTEDDIHVEEASKNPWYIRQYTLRLLAIIGKMSERIDRKASKMDCPILVLHGGNDIFVSPDKVKDFCDHIPAEVDKTRKYYPDSYHLLMYDHHRDVIFKDISKWLSRLVKQLN